MNWFLSGKLNASYNCVDRHADESPEKIALIWEGDDPNDCRKISYLELRNEVK